MAVDDARLHGIDLRLLRVSRRIKAVEVARKAGWSRQRVSAVEATDVPGQQAVETYLRSLRSVERGTTR